MAELKRDVVLAARAVSQEIAAGADPDRPKGRELLATNIELALKKFASALLDQAKAGGQ